MKQYQLGLILLFCHLVFILNAQKVGSVGSEVRNGKVYVHYLVDAKFYNEFNISLYVSRDNGQTYIGPLKEVTGDIGKVNKEGWKTIVWDPMKEMPFVSETLIFDVRAEIIRNKPMQSFFMMFVGNTTTYFGLRAGLLGRVGFYAELRGNLMAMNTGEFSYQDGTVDYNQPGYYTFTGSNGYAAFSALVGVNYQPAKKFFLYLGAGYGKEDYLMKIDEFSYDGDINIGSSYVKYDQYSHSGVEIDLGVMYRIKMLMLSGGATMINFKTFGWTAGIGISL
ncbi:MAG: hypothetical protein EOM90_14325 [Alphaproteobacteria bacterium]|nr:hypothetical protein [Alphaproteobacteria bacterium]